jgi:hypothetical protein
MSATLGRKRLVTAIDAQQLANARAQAASPGAVMRLTRPRPRRWSPRERHGVNARTCLVTTLVLLVALLSAAPGTSLARGSSYVFDGGTPAQRRQVDRALAVSTFPWNKVRATITIHIDRGSRSEALPGHIWLDADLLDSGQFSWGTIQHEYAHQVDFFLFSDGTRARLLRDLGGREWCYAVPDLPHEQYGCERFASTLAWAYWPSSSNSMRPESPSDESAAMRPQAFRTLMAGLLEISDS